MLVPDQSSIQAGSVDALINKDCSLPVVPLQEKLEKRIRQVQPEWLRYFGITLSEKATEQAPIVAFFGLSNRKVSAEEKQQWQLQLLELISPLQVGRVNIYHREPPKLENVAVVKPPNGQPRHQLLSTAVLLQDAQRTLPSGIVLLNGFRYQIALQQGACEFVVFKCYLPPEKEAALVRWIEEFEEQHHVDVVIQRERNYLGVRPLLEELAGVDGLLTDHDLPRIQAVLGSFYGHCPEGALTSNIPAHYVDMTEIPFVAIDGPSTRDVEDALFVERMPNGEIRHVVAIADVTTLITPDSPLDIYASKLGSSIYGLHRIIPTLGQFVSFNLASFIPEEVRMAWVSERLISLDGQVRSVSPPYLASVRVRYHIDSAELSRCLQNGHQCRETIELLSEAGALLRQSRLRSKTVMRLAQEAGADLIVGESMIAANRDIAAFLAEQPDCPAIFKVHAAPTADLQRRLAREIVDLGIPACADDLEDPLQFMGIIKALQTRSFQHQSDSQEHRKVVHLINRIIDRYLMRSSFDLYPAVHHGLKVSRYCSLKARTAVGIANQMQLRSLCDSGYSRISADLMAGRVKQANRQSRAYRWKVSSLITFEMLEKHLAQVSQLFKAAVEEVKGRSLIVEVPGFQRWGVVDKVGKDRNIASGDKVLVRLEGFDVPRMRFKFALLD